jgi:hypothetical protein
MAELVDTYLDLPLGIVDAAVIAIAERLRLAEDATIDHRHFSVVRPRHVPAFTRLLGTRPGRPGHAEHWSNWRRCHQARARWYHQRTRLARDPAIALVS